MSTQQSAASQRQNAVHAPCPLPCLHRRNATNECRGWVRKLLTASSRTAPTLSCNERDTRRREPRSVSRNGGWLSANATDALSRDGKRQLIVSSSPSKYRSPTRYKIRLQRGIYFAQGD
jgi:hypothetical protein